MNLLEQALDDLDSVAGNVTLDESLGHPIFTTQIAKSLSAIVDIDVSADTAIGEVQLNGLVEIRADVTLNIVFGFDANGFFIDPLATTGPELTLSNFSVDGEVTGEGRLGFLGVELKEADFLVDPGARIAFDMVDPGTDLADDVIRGIELFPEDLDQLFDMSIVGDPGDGVDDFVLTGLFGVKAVLPGVDAPIDLLE